jgi:hypothetical protein
MDEMDLAGKYRVRQRSGSGPDKNGGTRARERITRSAAAG